MKLLIDADYLIYSAGFAVEQNYYAVDNDEGVLTVYNNKREANEHKHTRGGNIWHRMEPEPVTHAYHSLNLMIEKIAKSVEAELGTRVDDPQLYLTGRWNYREQLATIKPYKGNRNPAHQPVYKALLREYLIKNYKAKVVDYIEADDMVSIIQTQYGKGCVVAGIDKDLLQVPGYHYVPDKGLTLVNERVGYLRFYHQILMGDATDNIPGMYRIGKAKALKLLKEQAEGVNTDELDSVLWPYVVELYQENIDQYGAEKHGNLTAEEAALENARLVHMLRKLPENKTPTEKELWSPKL